MRLRRGVYFIPPGGPPLFPDPRFADPEGLLAIGGDLSVERLLAAYDQGIFPWYEQGYPPCWWSPDPRAVMNPDWLHVSRSLARLIRQGRYELTWNRAFGQVIEECGLGRPGGTWIVPEMVSAYRALHALGHAHSLELWIDGRLAGGLYGVQRGALFAAESMFHRESNASKLALVACVRSLFSAGIRLFDVQFLTPHLASLGAREISRVEYSERVAEVRQATVDLRSLVPRLLDPGA
jgi:leucyl/phenylalanyl-tRNA--protein transferase